MKKKTDELIALENKYIKMIEFYYILVNWLQLSQSGVGINSYFEEHEYHSVAIYGMKELSERLIYELKKNNIEIRYIIDQNADFIYCDQKIIKPDEELDTVDVLIVTAIHYFDEIKTNLEKKVSFPIVSIEDIINSLLEKII